MNKIELPDKRSIWRELYFNAFNMERIPQQTKNTYTWNPSMIEKMGHRIHSGFILQNNWQEVFLKIYEEKKSCIKSIFRSVPCFQICRWTCFKVFWEEFCLWNRLCDPLEVFPLCKKKFLSVVLKLKFPNLKTAHPFLFCFQQVRGYVFLLFLLPNQKQTINWFIGNNLTQIEYLPLGYHIPIKRLKRIQVLFFFVRM